MKRLHSRKGFSLVEVILALGIFSVLASVAYGIFMNQGDLTQLRIDHVQAQQLAIQRLEHLRACSYDQLDQWVPSASPEGFAGEFNAQKFAYRVIKQKHDDGSILLTVHVGRHEPVDEGPLTEQWGIARVRGIKTP